MTSKTTLLQQPVFPLKPLTAAIRHILAGGLLCLAPTVQAADTRLPVPAQTWVGAGQAGKTVHGNRMTIQQQTDRVTLNWRSFDIGKDAGVTFQQPSASSIALNRIDQANPSEIFGHLSANGQIYLVNHNGFVFGTASRVDANTLVATNLDISDDVFQRGITKVIGQDGSAALNGSGEVYLRDAEGNYLLDAQGQRQKIQISLAPGAQIKTTDGGRVLLAAPKVDNQGSIATPDGQTLLIGGTDKVYLQEAGADSDVRGLLVEVKTGGEADNHGSIDVGKGNATLLGYAVNQDGLISAKTSVRSNGSIRLLARENAQTLQQNQSWLLQATSTRRATAGDDGLGDRATVNLGKGSVTQVLPDSADPTTAVDSQPQQASSVTAQGDVVAMADGALIHAPAGNVELSATEHPENPGQTGVANDSRIQLDAGSKIDVSGITGVAKPMDSNVVAVELHSNELRDSPLQRNGLLNGKTVYVDVRQGTPLADISGAVAQIGRTVDERSTNGGSVALHSEGAVVSNQGALVNISGGSVNYQSGTIHTTQLVADDGSIVDIGEADPNRQYVAILGDLSTQHPRWGITESWGINGPIGQGLYQDGYTQGKDAGSVDIQANQLLLDGRILAATQLDLLQRMGTPPLGGALSIDLARAPNSLQDILLQGQAPATPLGLDEAFPTDAAGYPAPLLLAANRFFADGLSRLVLKTQGTLRIAHDALVRLQEGGSFSASAGQIDMAGAIAAPGGQVALQTQLSAGNQGLLDGSVTMQPGSAIDVGGVFVNDTGVLQAQHTFAPTAIDGGSVAIKTDQGDLTVSAGAQIRADGGAWLDQRGQTNGGRGGSIALESAGIDGSNLKLAGTLSAYGLQQGGTLSLTTHEIRLGAAPSAQSQGGLTPLRLLPEFFTRGGFSQYNLASNLNGITLEDNAQIHPQTQNLLFNGDPRLLASGSDMGAITHPTLLPEALRQPAGISLGLVQSVGQGRDGAGLYVGSKASLSTDPQGSIALNSDASIYVKGSIAAPAGSVALTITTPKGVLEPGFLPNQGIWLDDGSRVSAQGAALLQSDALGLTRGQVLDGGNISLTANRGYIVAAPTSTLDASGTSAWLDQPGPVQSGQLALPVAMRMASAGGSITLAAAEGMILGGSMRAEAGAGETTADGTLSVTVNPNLRLEPVDPLPPDQQFLRIPPAILLTRRQQEVLTQEQRDTHTLPLELNGQVHLSSEQIDQGHFAELNLSSTQTIRFDEALDLSVAGRLTLDAPQIQWGGSDAGSVNLQASYVALGSSQFRQPLATPAAGLGALSVQANLIDLVGGMALDGYSDTQLSSSGDIRLRGIRVNDSQRDFVGYTASAGNLSLNSAQVYTTTLSDYTLQVTEAGGKLSFAGNGAATGTVLSVGGKLTAQADHIEQGGVVKAPQGEIILQAGKTLQLTPGSRTSVSLDGALVPFGRTQGGLDWLYPLDLQNLVLQGPPQKIITLSAPSLAVDGNASVDLSGGGDLYAFEFIKGPGGSADILDPQDPAVLDGSVAYQPKYAILPEVGSFSPYDPLEFPASGLKVGDSVYLAAGSGLPAGNYALLPAHYALLPGAFLVTPQTDIQDLTPGQVLPQQDGSLVVAGYRDVAGTDMRDARWSGFAVAPGSSAKTYSEYQESYASQFFAEQALRQESARPLLPQDAGRLVLQATKSLALDGEVLATATGDGIGGRLDVDAAHLAIAPRGTAASAGTITLAAEDLMNMDLSSLLLGGVREETAAGTSITTTAQSVEVAAGTQLEKADILLTAKQSLHIGANAQLSATPATASDTAANWQPTFQVDGNSALLRLSNGPQAVLTRQGNSSGHGSLTVDSGALLAAGGSLLLNAGGAMRLDGNLAANGGSVQLGAGQISLGDAPAGTTGLVLDNAMLQGIQADQLVLSSANAIAVYGAADLQQQDLVLDAAGLAGQGSAQDTATLAAATLTFSNHNAPVQAAEAAGQGSLVVDAKNLVLGAGDYALTGFRQITLRGSERIGGADSGTLHAAGDLALQAGQFTGANGADTSIDASGHNIAVTTAGTAGGEVGLGARWNMQADALSVAGHFALPAGQLHLQALQGDLELADGARIDVAGRALPLAGTTVYADGGLVELAADQGDLRLASGAAIDVSAAAGGGDAGTLKLAATQGQVDVQADLAGNANAQSQPGSFFLDANTLTADQLAQLNQHLAVDGFARTIAIRQRQGDMAIPAGATVQAQTISLSADQGELQVAGTLDASGTQGGTVALAGGGGVDLASSAAILARATADGQDGGSVLLDASIGDASSAGSIVLSSGAKIDVSGGAKGAGGKVTLRALRLDTPAGIAIATPAASIEGAQQVAAEGVAVYQQDSGVITSSDIAAWKTATSQYMQNADAIEQRLGGQVTLVPALDVRSDGDLVLQNNWNLLSWRYGSQPGALTLRAAGDINLQANLSDAFANGAISTPFGDLPVNNLLQPGQSWSYHLVADGSVNLAKGVMLRTGTGSISIDAGQDVLLTRDKSAEGNNAVIYTAGRPTDSNRYGSFSNAIVGFLFYGEYPVDGGDITINAGHNVQGAAGSQMFSDWLVRTGSWSSEGAVGNTLPTAWAIDLQTSGSGSAFKQGVGALGGGNVTVNAGGDVTDLSVLIPTTGKQVGTPADPGSIYDLSFSTNQVQVQGGGNLQVQAAGNIDGGVYYTGAGSASVAAGGSIGGSNAPWFAMGQGRLSASAGGDLTVGGVFNPTLLPQSAETSMDNISSFFTYDAGSAASFLSRAGSVVLQNDVETLLANTSLGDLADSNSSHMLQVYPGQVQASAPAGDIRIERDFLLYPSAAGQLALAAGGNIGTASTGNAVTVTQSDADPALLPNVQTPAQDLTDAYNRLQPYGSADLIHAAQPLHAGDTQRAEIVAQAGDIAGQDPLHLVLATAAYVYAGHDISGVSIDAQNNNATDVSEILAGRDIRYTTERDPLTGNLLNLTQQIGLSGPGQLQVMAGRNIDLGSSEGIVTLGSQLNPALPQGGASITVLAGLTAQGIATLDDQSGPPVPPSEDSPVDFSGTYAAFIKTYLEPSPTYQQALVDYMRPYGGAAALSPEQALARFKALPANAQRKFLLDVMYEEVRQAGTAAAKDPSVGNQRGFDAIAALFPGHGYQGDLTLFFSKIHSVDGGDIDIAVPGGLVNAGLAVAFGGAKPASDLGIVAQSYGAINAVVEGDFLVNQSRVFALDGGDITLWSSAGNIDAGRGAKTSLSVPPPIVSFDAKGNLQVIFPPVVSGSGIRTAASSLDKTPGDVYLFAPKGVVDAGEAGIGGNNVTIGATAVIGAANIQVGGSSTGVPVAPTVNIGAIAGAGNVASSVAQNAQQTANSGMERNTDKNALADNSLATAILDVDVLGWGE